MSQYLSKALLAALVYLLTITTSAAFEIEFRIDNISDEIKGDLEVSFKFFKDNELVYNDEHGEIVRNDDRSAYGSFDVPYDVPDALLSEGFDTFYFYGVLYRADGSGERVGLLPLHFVEDPDPLDRGRYYVESYRLYILGDNKSGVASDACWKDVAQEARGRAARESFPLAANSAVRHAHPVATLLAISDLIEKKFINTCATWNRIRALLRDDMSIVWANMSSEDLNTILRYMRTVYQFANDKDYKEIPKIYNETLSKIFENRGGGARIDGKEIREYLFDQQVALLRRHLYKIVWKLDRTIDMYLVEKEYEKCFKMFNHFSELMQESSILDEKLAEIRALQNVVYRILRNANNCAAESASSKKVQEIAEHLSKFPDGMEYMALFVDFFDYLNTTAATMFPYNTSKATNPHMAREVIKYRDPYANQIDHGS